MQSSFAENYRLHRPSEVLTVSIYSWNHETTAVRKSSITFAKIQAKAQRRVEGIMKKISRTMKKKGRYLLHVFVGEEPPEDLRQYMHDPQTSEAFQVFGGAVFFAGAEYGYRDVDSALRRYGLTARSFGHRLASLFRDAGIERPAELVENMISMMEKPEGLYL